MGIHVLDIFILLFLVSAILRGYELGFVRQFFSTLGFFSGLLLGAWLQPYIIHIAHHSAFSRGLVTLITTLGFSLLFLALGEYTGVKLKQKLQLSQRFNPYDNGLGSVLGGVSILLIIWLSAAILSTLPYPSVQSTIRGSRIVSMLTQHLPPAPNVVADLGHLINPNGFPQVFTGIEPRPRTDINPPSLGEMQAAVTKDQKSVVKVEGTGCGGIVEGSGFVVGNDLIATNAHVIAGIRTPYVVDDNGTHATVPIWFDPDVDFAILRVANLAGNPLVLNTAAISTGTAAAVLGYPGGGGFMAGPAAIMDEFTANGRNIYNEGRTERDVFEVSADIVHGNSGGPLVIKDGTVIGVIFAESTRYNHVGYALSVGQLEGEIDQAQAQNRRVSTGSCAE